MADNCVNRSAKEFKDLARQSVIKPIMLAAKVGLWQDKNNTTEFPKDVAEVNEIDNISTGQLEIDFDEADIQKADKKVMKKARSLALGEELTSKDIMETKRADSDYIENILFKNNLGAFDKEYNKAGVLTGIVISPEVVRGRGGKNAYGAAQNYAKILNNSMPNTKGVANIAEVEKLGDSYRINVRLPRQMAIIRSYFPINRNANFLRFTRKLFVEEAAKTMMENKEITSKQFIEIYKRRELDDVTLNEEEMRDIANRDIGNNYSSVVINGERVFDYNEYINREDEGSDSVSFEDSELSPNDPININNYISRREKQIENLDKIKDSLISRQKITEDNKKYTAQLDQIDSITKALKEDLQDLNGGVLSNLDKLEQSFDKDFELISEIHNNPTKDNRELANDAIKFVGHHINESARRWEEAVIREDIQDSQKLLDLVSKIAEKHRLAQEEQSRLAKDSLVESIQDIGTEYVTENQITEEEMFEELFEYLEEDTDTLSEYIQPLGRDYTVDDKLGRYIRYFSEIESQKRHLEALERIQRINELFKQADPKMKELGMSSLEIFSNLTKGGDLQLVSKFNNSWRDILSKNTYINKNKRFESSTKGDLKQIGDLLNDKHNELNDTANKIDFRYLPEVQEALDTDFLKKEFGGYKVDNTYRNKLVKELGEAEYENLVTKQINLLFDYEIRVNKVKQSYLDSIEGVDSYEDLEDHQKKYYDENISKKDNPKTIFEQNNDKKYKIKYDNTSSNVWITMDYNVFYPKKEREDLYDDKFQLIEENPELIKLWKELKLSLRLINENLSASELNIPTNKSFFFLMKSIADTWQESDGLFSPSFSALNQGMTNTYQMFKDAATTELEAYDPDGPVKVSGQAVTFKSKVDRMFSDDSDIVRSITEKSLVDETFNFDSLNTEEKKRVFKELGVKDEKEFRYALDKNGYLNRPTDIKKIPFKAIRVFSKAKVYKTQKTDLVVMMKVLLEVSANTKARQDTKNFIRNSIDVVIRNKEKNLDNKSLRGKRLEKKVEFFKKAVVDGFRNTAGQIDKEKMESLKQGNLQNDLTGIVSKRNFTPEEKRIRKILVKEIRRNKEILKSPEIKGEMRKNLKAQIKYREERLALMGKHYTARSISEFVGGTVDINATIALSPLTSIMDFIQARQQAEIQSGFIDNNGQLQGEYSYEQMLIAYDFVKSALHNNFITKRIKGKKRNEEIQKAHLITQRLNVIQDGTDPMQRAERLDVGRKPTLNVLKKEARHGMFMQEFSNYYNQMPIVLASLMNTAMPDLSAMFDGDSFPHHEIVDGEVVLKKESREKFKREYGLTDETLTSRYEKFNSMEAIIKAVHLKNEVITKRNGDYSVSGISMLKGNTFGRVYGKFSTFAGGISYSAYGSNAKDMATGKSTGGYINNAFLSEEGRILYSAISGQSILNTMFSSPVGILLSNIPVIWGTLTMLPLLYEGGKQIAFRVASKGNVSESQLKKNYWRRQAMKMLLFNMSGGTLNFMMNKVAGMMGISAKKSLKRNFKFDYTFGGNLDNRTAIALQQGSKQQMYLTYVGLISSLIFEGISQLDWDEEEKETKGTNMVFRKEQESTYSKTGDRIRTFATNVQSRVYGDASLTTSPHEFFHTLNKDKDGSGMFNTGFIGPAIGTGIDGLFTDDDVYGGNSMYKGDNKVGVLLRKGILPKMLRNIGKEEWAFGLENAADQTYQKPRSYEYLLVSPYRKARQKARLDRSKLERELKEKYDYDKQPTEVRDSMDEIISDFKKSDPRLNVERSRFDINQQRTKDDPDLKSNNIKVPFNDDTMSYDNGERMMSEEETKDLVKDLNILLDKDLSIDDILDEL